MIRTGLPSGDQEDSSTFKFEMRPSDLLTTEGDPNNEAGLEEEGVDKDVKTGYINTSKLNEKQSEVK